jgi:glucosamine 6-phosphate synthetase-like amidotransferase/phosphosugar isomerase protein
MCGIVGYVNYLVEKKRSEILAILLNGLARLEYRGYDSAGKWARLVFILGDRSFRARYGWR